VIDVDYLRGVNDAYGHDAGDEVLRSIAATLAGHLRRTDVIARYDAEQFCVIAVNAGETSLDTFERLRQEIGGLEIRHAGHTIRVTVSIGFTRQLGDSLADTLRHAEALVQKAKRDGRDRVVADGAAEQHGMEAS
jgi:diguanylate cyclase (GGDEF)-like protein